MDNSKGVIYILTNPSFPDYVKIGYADDIEKRLKQLNRSECVPFAFRVYATYEVNSRLSDLKIHSIIDKLNPDLRSIDEFNGQKRVRLKTIFSRWFAFGCASICVIVYLSSLLSRLRFLNLIACASDGV